MSILDELDERDNVLDQWNWPILKAYWRSRQVRQGVRLYQYLYYHSNVPRRIALRFLSWKFGLVDVKRYYQLAIRGRE